jgi:hypothetical protein
MQTDLLLFRSERRVSNAKGPVPLQTSAEFARRFKAQAHEIVDAITAVVINAEAGQPGCALNRRIWKESGWRSMKSPATVSEQPNSSFDFERS